MHFLALSNTISPLEYIFNLAKNNKIHHALILSGQKGIGKTSLAYYIAKFFLSYKIDEFKNLTTFDIDNNVDNLITKNTHPNFIVVTPEFDPKKNKFKDFISVDEIRNLKTSLATTNDNDSYRVIIINSIDILNNNAANALLKTLEEPLGNTIFILICHNYKNLLDTIKSRTLNINIKNLSHVDLEKLITHYELNITPQYKEGLLKLASGSFSKLQWYLEKDNINTYKVLMNSLKSSDINDITTVIDYLKGNKNLSALIIFEILENYILNNFNNQNMEKFNKLLTEILTLKQQTTLLNLDIYFTLTNLLFKIKA